MATLPKIVLNSDLREGLCFGCGRNNPIGLKLNFTRESDTLRAEFTPDTVHQGWPGVVHGGILAALLDEAMSNAAFGEGITCLTASLEMRLKKPAMVQEKLVVTARVTRNRKRLVETEASLCLEDGTVVAEGTAKQFVAEGEPNDTAREKRHGI